MRKYRFRTAYRWLHGTLGLISGLVVFILGITGFLYSFEKEIQEYTQPFRFYDVPLELTKGDELLPSQLMEIAQRELPKHEIHSIKYVKWQPEVNLENQMSKQRAAEVIFYHSSEDSTYYYKIFLNPRSGEVFQVHNMLDGFFAWVLRGHFYLWLPSEIGKLIVATATLLFFILIFLGLILWFPKRWTKIKSWKQRLTTQWSQKTRWRRKNFDLHGLIGFYSLLGALVLSITGLYYGFNWWAMLYYKSLGGKKEVIFEEPLAKKNSRKQSDSISKLYLEFKRNNPKSDNISNATTTLRALPTKKEISLEPTALDRIYGKYKSRLDTGIDVMMEIHPQKDSNKCVEVSFNSSYYTYGGSEYEFVDPTTLELQPVQAIYGSRKGRSFADKMMLWNYDIHTGGILGWWGKLLMAIFSLMIATLPITGVLMWWGRRNK